MERKVVTAVTTATLNGYWTSRVKTGPRDCIVGNSLASLVVALFQDPFGGAVG